MEKKIAFNLFIFGVCSHEQYRVIADRAVEISDILAVRKWFMVKE